MTLEVQTLVVAIIVGMCAVYALWVLLPAAARRAFAAAAFRLPLPARWAESLRNTPRLPRGCACQGCDRASPKTAATLQPVTFQPRARR